MISELLIAIAIGGLTGLSIFEIAGILMARPGSRPRRLLRDRPGKAPNDRLYDIGGRFMAGLPKTWSAGLMRWSKAESAAGASAAAILNVDPAAFVGARVILASIAFLTGWIVFGGGPGGLALSAMLAYGAQSRPGRQSKSTAGRRRLEFGRLLPDFIEMLAIGVEAGLSLDRGIRLYCDRFENRLAEAFGATMTEIELGKPRRQSFQELADRNRNDDLTWFVTSILQAEKLGSPLAQSLKEQARAERQRQGELIRELSATAPIKMLFPIAGLILPALFIIILGPAFLQLTGR